MRLLIIITLSIAALFAETPRRTLLLQLPNVPEKTLNSVLSPMGGLEGDALISYLADTAMVLATHAEAALLKERGTVFSTLLEDTSLTMLARRALFGSSLSLPAVYHTYEEILAEGDALIHEYPSLIRKIPIGRTSRDGRQIFAFQLGQNVRAERDVPAIMFDACHHADEIMGAEICTALMHELIERSNLDSAVAGWLRDFTIYIIPVVNVDGHTIVTHGIDPGWRKNGRGVDINRNYDFNWAHGGSDDPASDRYRGAFPFSEGENRAMRDFLKDRKVLLSISYHSQGEVIYYPWTWSGRKAPDDKLLTSLAFGLASRITTMKGDTCYKAEYGAGTVGQTYPWLYGTKGTFDFVVETGRGAHIFPERDIAGIVRSNLAGAHYILDCGRGPGLTGHVTDAKTGKALDAIVWFPAIETEDVHRRTTAPATGRFWRLLSPGKYLLIVQKEGYAPRVIKDVEVRPTGWTNIDVALTE